MWRLGEDKITRNVPYWKFFVEQNFRQTAKHQIMTDKNFERFKFNINSFQVNVSFLNPLKHQKASGFLLFSKSIERERLTPKN